MRCDQCKHWSDKPEQVGWEAEDIGFRECKAVRERWIIQDAANGDVKYYTGDDDAGEEAWTKRRVDALKASRAYVQDGSEYRAELVTGPDFFCALFEKSK
jgi:hypothetical protein